MSNHIYSEYLNESTNSSNKFICQYVECRKPLPAKNGKYCNLTCCNRENALKQSLKAWERRKEKEIKYSKNPKLCQQCNKSIEFIRTLNGPVKFCDHSCATTYNNSIRSSESRAKQRTKVTHTMRTKYHTPGPHCKIEWYSCPITKKLYHSRTSTGIRRKQSPYAKDLKQIYYRLSRFKFNVYNMSDLFDTTLIETYGWYSCPGKKRKNDIKNLNGISRDHRYSVSEGFKNRVHPLLLSHPVNCSLVLQSVNKRKDVNCEITVEQLLSNIKNFDNLKHKFQSHMQILHLIDQGKIYLDDFEMLRSLV